MEHLRTKYSHEITSILLDGFETELLDAAFINLLTPNPLRLNNFAYALRELTRHLLHRLAPSDELQSCTWFKPDPTSKTGITRSHRIKFAIQGGLSDFYVINKLKIDELNDVSKNLIKIISELSNYTHVEHTTFNTELQQVENVATKCLDATLHFVQKINELRVLVAERLLNDVDSVLLDRINSESVEELMELSTHQFIEEIDPDTIVVEKIGVTSLKMQVDGTIHAILMYGSASDRRKDNGAEIPVSFPVHSEMEVHFKQPLGSDIDLDIFSVDTSSWYD
ncbi:hypothetical protein ACED29_17230 [Shewanella sp. 5S214]|uniref:pPIWI-associating nuclease domain-containing protein n=1 Tax=Shewanella sp. 5S214 TaxID=3229999 RepID=UPI00352EF888